MFLDITADWCATCQFNKLNVLDKKNIIKLFEDNIKLVRADWTNLTNKLIAFLKVLISSEYRLMHFSPKYPDGLVMSELLTEKEIKQSIEMLKWICRYKCPIIKNGNSELVSLRDEFDNKKIVLFGIPGAFTPTCSEEHFPGYIKLYDKIISKGVNDIYCLSVNDKYVMKSWLISYSEEHNIFGIADGNAQITTYFI